MGIDKYFALVFRYKDLYWYLVKAELKSDITNKALGCLWWILDPLMFMVIYIIVVQVIWERGGPLFPVFAFCALLPWKWTSSCIRAALKSISAKSALLQQISVPKLIFPLVHITVNTAKYLLSTLILLVMLVYYDVGFSVNMLYFIPVFLVHLLFITGIGLLMAHWGVYFSDLDNILVFGLRLWFYMSPGLYDLSRVPQQWQWIWRLNPMTHLFSEYRNALLFQQPLEGNGLLYVAVLSIFSICYSLNEMSRHELDYGKVV